MAIQKAQEPSAYFWRILTRSTEDAAARGALTLDSGRRAGLGTFKATKDFARVDTACRTLCSISIACEAISGTLVWYPISGKMVTLSVLKATSVGCQKFRDLCAADPSSPLC